MDRPQWTLVSLALAFTGLAFLLSLQHGAVANAFAPIERPPQALFQQGSIGLDTSPTWLSGDTDLQTQQLAWGDVDGDGDLDLAAVNSGDGANRLYLNNSGVLETDASWVADDNAYSSYDAAWGDVDGDGDLDLAVANRTELIIGTEPPGTNAIYLNQNGQLETTPTWRSDEADQSNALAWGDVDGDGDLDLAVANEEANRLYENVNGTLQTTAVWSSTEEAHSTDLAWGDVDNDGDLDLAVASRFTQTVLYENVNGTLETTASWSAPRMGKRLAWGDVDGDGDLDLAVSGETPLFLNINGVLQSDPWQPTLGGNAALTTIAWTDIDGDGDLDLSMGNFVETFVYINNGVGSGGPTDAVTLDSALALALPAGDAEDLKWGDVDGDSDLDLAVATWFGFNKLFLNSGLPLPASSTITSGTMQIQSMALADVDGDDDLDLAIGYVGPNQLLLNQNGLFSSSVLIPSDDDIVTNAVAWADFDGDGDLDLATGNAAIGLNSIISAVNHLYENVDGTLISPPIWTSSEADLTQDLAWADVDRDGDLDLAVANDGQNRIYRNSGAGLEAIAWWTSDSDRPSTSVTWGDVDQDGDPDLAFGNATSFGQRRASNQLYLNEGGVLAATSIWDSADSDETTDIAWADADGDGDLDLSVANSSGLVSGGAQRNKIYWNDSGQLRTATETIWQSADTAHTDALAWGDIDGDTDLDLIAVNNTFETCETATVVYLNQAGQLQTTPSWQTETDPFLFGASDISHALLADLNRDGSLDLLTGSGEYRCIFGEAGFQGLRTHTNSLHMAPVLPEANSASIRVRKPLADADALTRSSPNIFARRTISIPFTLSRPTGGIRARFSIDGGGSWQEAVPAPGAQTAHLVSGSYTFPWDVHASGFFGESDNVVVRIEAVDRPATSTTNGTYLYTNQSSDSFQRASASSTTNPFRVRGTQVQVQDASGASLSGAIVYRRSGGSTGRAQAMGVADQVEPFSTNAQGFLEGRGTLGRGDQLIALWPVSATHAFSLYQTSAAPTEIGLDFATVSELGVQALTVSPDNPLILFNLDVSLEWDATNDGTFLQDLESAIVNSSEVLFDVTEGQVALGQVLVHQAKQNWVTSDVVIYASSSIHPRASMGGVVISGTNDIGVSGVISDAYLPGQIRMGPNWDPFGQNQADLTQDWWLAFAHELAHYLLFLPDNYIGVQDGLLKTTNCQGSFMTNTYDAAYREFLTRDGWTGSCEQTVAANTTNRTDWETITRFLPWISAPASQGATNPGPGSLPVNVTRVKVLPLPSLAQLGGGADSGSSLPARNFDLRDAQTGNLLTLQQAQGYLFKTQGTPELEDDYALALGSTGAGSDRMKVRGAADGDRVCMLDPNGGRVGCEAVTAQSTRVELHETPNWQPDIVVRPVSSRTLIINVTQPISPGAEMAVQVLPAYGAPTQTLPITSPWAIMDEVAPGQFQKTITLPNPAFEGFVRAWVPGIVADQEAVTQYFLSAAWGPNFRGSSGGSNERVWGPNFRGSSGGANRRSWGANNRSLAAPVASGDGNVTVYNLQDVLADTGTSSLQAISSIPNLPEWLTAVGRGYRYEASDAVERTIAFHYLQRNVPDGFEFALNLYYSVDGQTWQRLTTQVDTDENLAAAQMPTNEQSGSGIYALVTTIELPVLATGWNLVSYPLPETRSISNALTSLENGYTSVYQYKPANVPPWRLYDQTVVAEHPDFVEMVNDLTLLEFGESYWLYATKPFTPYLGVVAPLNAAASAEMQPQTPPATFYGLIEQAGGATVSAGDTIAATINGNFCLGLQGVDSTE